MSRHNLTTVDEQDLDVTLVLRVYNKPGHLSDELDGIQADPEAFWISSNAIVLTIVSLQVFATGLIVDLVSRLTSSTPATQPADRSG